MTMSANGREPDDELLDVLAHAVGAAEPVPPHVVAAAKSAYTWRTVDAELAELARDSPQETDRLVGVRSTQAPIRSLTFEVGALTMEVDVTGEGLLGQLTPAVAAEVAVESLAGISVSVAADEWGFFALRPAPSGLVRLRFTAAGTGPAVTPWIRL
jgi:hypothetical protein